MDSIYTKKTKNKSGDEAKKKKKTTMLLKLHILL